MKNFLYLALIVGFAFSSCAKKKAEKQADADETIIQNYIAANGLIATATGTGLYYVINEAGAGQSCTANSDVKVAYKGYLPNGNVFDESADGISFNLQGVIRGWTEGIPFFKEGGNGILLIPSALGYGTNAVGSIPANSVLIFEVELIEVF